MYATLSLIVRRSAEDQSEDEVDAGVNDGDPDALPVGVQDAVEGLRMVAHIAVANRNAPVAQGPTATTAGACIGDETNEDGDKYELSATSAVRS
jgi:hypothetical protein